MNKNQRLSLVAAVCTGTAGLMSAIQLIGETATLAKMLIVFFGGLAAGVALMTAIRPVERRKTDAADSDGK